MNPVDQAAIDALKRPCPACHHLHHELFSPIYFTSRGVCIHCAVPYTPELDEKQRRAEPTPHRRATVDQIRDEDPREYDRVLSHFTAAQKRIFTLYFDTEVPRSQPEVARMLHVTQQAVGRTIERIRRRFINAGLPVPEFPARDEPGK